MAIRFESCPRLPRIPLLPSVAVGLWGLALGFLLIQGDGSETGAELCLIRATTGAVCPTCGATRAGLSLLDAEPSAALRLNPLVTVALGLAVCWIGVRVVFARQLVFSTSRRGWIRGAVVLILLVGANWVYVAAALPSGGG